MTDSDTLPPSHWSTYQLMFVTPSAGASMLGLIESFGPNVANPSTSLSSSPASATAAFTARAASVNTPTPESFENSVQPMPAIAAWPRGKRAGSPTRGFRAVADASDEATVLRRHEVLSGVIRQRVTACFRRDGHAQLGEHVP